MKASVVKMMVTGLFLVGDGGRKSFLLLLREKRPSSALSPTLQTCLYRGFGM